MKISIVLPVYNGEKTIASAIESVLKQTLRDIELIIVNDCSTDGTADIIQKYALADDRVKIINNSQNMKLPRSLNIGFSCAQGEYYTWTSDDNLYKIDALEKMVLILEKDRSYDMVYSNYERIREDGKIIGRTELDAPEKLLYGNVIGACFLYRSSIAEKVGSYDPNLFLAEDYDYWLRIYKNGKIRHIEETLYYYREHSGSLTETRKTEIGLQTYRALEKNFLFLVSCCENKEQRFAFYNQLYRRLEGQSAVKEKLEKTLMTLDRDYNNNLVTNRFMSNVKRFIKKFIR